MKKFYPLLLILACTTASHAQVTLVKTMRAYSYFYRLGNQLLFFGNNDADIFSPNYELWATDGTTAGTHLVQDIYPGTNSGIPQQSEWDNGSGSYRPFV